jgi:ADP-heptose:LPS heptosyltransferase
MTQSSPPVLIIRLDGIGDALALTPLLSALQERSIPFDLVLTEANARIFAAAAANRVEIAPFAPRCGTSANIASVREYGEKLKARPYDSVLVATEDSAGYRLAREIGARRRVGFANGWGKPFKTLWVRSMLTTTLYRSAGPDTRGKHECEVLFELGGGLVADAMPTKDNEKLRRLVLSSEVARSDNVALQITDKWLRFGAHVRELATLIGRVAKKRPVHLVAAETEGTLASAVENASGVPVERFAEVEPWKEAIAASRLLVAPDSGATHVAGMVGTPTVAIFENDRRFQRQVARWHPWAAPYRAHRVDGDWVQRVVDSVDILLL